MDDLQYVAIRDSTCAIWILGD